MDWLSLHGQTLEHEIWGTQKSKLGSHPDRWQNGLGQDRIQIPGDETIQNIRFFQVNFSCHKLIFLKYWARVLLNYFHFCNTLLSKHEPSFFQLQLKINRNLIKTAVGELDQFVFQKHRSCWIRNSYFWKTLQLWAY